MISLDRWLEIERSVLEKMDEKALNDYITSQIAWAKRKDEKSSGWLMNEGVTQFEVGDVVYADFGVAYNMEIGGFHPAVIVALLNGKALIVPLSSNLKNHERPNILIFKSECLSKTSVAFCNDAKFINTARISKIIGKAKEHEWRALKNYVMKGILNNGWPENN